MSHRPVALVTSNDVRYVDPEVAGIAQALGESGADAEVVAWDDELDWTAYRLVVVRSPWDYFDRVVEFCDWAALVDRKTRLVNPVDVLRWNSHKGYLLELASHGVSTVPTRLIPGASVDATQQLDECPWDEVVVKPAVDGGARHTRRGRRTDAAIRKYTESLTQRGDVIVQPFVPTISEGERSLVFFDGAFSHGVRKVPADGDYRTQFFYGGSEVPHEPDSAEVRVALAAMAAAPARLTYARVDLVDWEGIPSLIELEAIDPDLFLRGDIARMERLVAAILAELGRPAKA